MKKIHPFIYLFLILTAFAFGIITGDSVQGETRYKDQTMGAPKNLDYEESDILEAVKQICQVYRKKKDENNEIDKDGRGFSCLLFAIPAISAKLAAINANGFNHIFKLMVFQGSKI